MPNPFYNRRGVNLSFEERPNDLAKITTIKNNYRIELAKNNGFDLLRFRISVSSWFLDGSEYKRRESISRYVESIHFAINKGLSVIAVPFALNSDLGISSQFVLCDMAAQNKFFGMMQDLFAALPDSPQVALEFLNEPPDGCRPDGAGEEWSNLQKQIYATLRPLKLKTRFLITGGAWGKLDGLLHFDPTPYSHDFRTLFTFHYYEPFLFTHQGAGWTVSAYKFVDGLCWPSNGELDPAPKEKAMLRAAEDRNLTPLQKSRIMAKLEEDFRGWREQGALENASHRFSLVHSWAKDHGIESARVILGEFGVLRPSGNTSGNPRDGAAAWLKAARRAAEQNGFSWAIWDLDNDFSVLCSDSGPVKLCADYTVLFNGSKRNYE